MLSTCVLVSGLAVTSPLAASSSTTFLVAVTVTRSCTIVTSPGEQLSASIELTCSQGTTTSVQPSGATDRSRVDTDTTAPARVRTTLASGSSEADVRLVTLNF